MSETANRETVERVIEALNTRDLDLFHAQFHDDSVMEYPQSGERIVGAGNRRGAYGAFPGLPKVSPRRILVEGNLAVVEAKLDYGDGTPWQAVFVFELRDGKIARETAYWPQPFEAADWRAQWVERFEA
ncbi:MAG: nuclear transport factor 2 family protein [Gaiellaceae bacterium]